MIMAAAPRQMESAMSAGLMSVHVRAVQRLNSPTSPSTDDDTHVESKSDATIHVCECSTLRACCRMDGYAINIVICHSGGLYVLGNTQGHTEKITQSTLL